MAASPAKHTGTIEPTLYNEVVNRVHEAAKPEVGKVELGNYFQSNRRVTHQAYTFEPPSDNRTAINRVRNYSAK